MKESILWIRAALGKAENIAIQIIERSQDSSPRFLGRRVFYFSARFL
jgi:hypothetical protein